MEVVLDLRAVGDVEADRAEQRLDALQVRVIGCSAAARRAAPGQRDVERLRGELLRSSFASASACAARVERGFERLPWPR